MANTEGSLCMVVGLCALALLSAPTLVSATANETILFDNFDTATSDWHEGSGIPYTIRDGFVFLNISVDKEGEWCMIRSARNLDYSGAEMRLRWLGNPEGWGVWGFRLNPNELRFSWASNESDPAFQGLTAWSVVNSKYELLQPIPGVDITDWHTYTVIWEEGNGTFLIDGEIVANTNLVSKYPMGVILSNSGLRLEGTIDRVFAYGVELSTDQCMQIDYVRLFTVVEPALLPILALFLLPTFLRRRN